MERRARRIALKSSGVFGALEGPAGAGLNMSDGFDTFAIISLPLTGYTPGFRNVLWIFDLVKLVSQAPLNIL
jgi:hypothetical protein